MTSAPNRPQQLSGSNISGWFASIVLVVLFALGACTGSRQTGTDAQNANWPRVYNPKTGNYEPVEDPTTLVDTVSWSDNSGAAEPIGAYDRRPEGFKESYDVCLLMPFNAQQHSYFQDGISPRIRRFIHYYAGVRLAIDDLERGGTQLNVKTLDTKEDERITKEHLEDNRKTDVVIGPYNRECLKVAAEFAAKRKVPVISPWTPSIALDSPSDYFVQVNPGLSTHAGAIMSYIASNFENPEIFFVGQQGGRTDSRRRTYQSAYDTQIPNGPGMVNLNLPTGTVDYPDLDMTTMLLEDRPNVFVVPFYSSRDVDLINGFLRKLHAERGEMEVYVFGLPQWIYYFDINPDYLEGLNTHITSVQFFDTQDAEQQEFVTRYFNKYSTFPEPAAWQGYELMRYIGSSLQDHGVGFLNSMVDMGESDGFQLVPVFGDVARPEQKNPVQYIENRGIEMLIFDDYAYRKTE